MPDLAIDGRAVAVPEGATLLEAARLAGITIPALCFLEGYPHHTSCMVCLVEEEGSGSLVPACATPAASGQSIRTSSARARAARRASLELLLSEHEGDCEAPCSRACPAHADIPRMIRRLAAGDHRRALEAIMERLPLAGTLARICAAPCERSCRRKPVDSAVAICSLKRAAVEAGVGAHVPPEALFTPRVRPPTGRSVAIVGAGPAGLSAAYFLARDGHRCVVLDEQPEPGGMIRHRVDADRLPAGVLDADIALLARMGIELQPGRRIVAGPSFDELRRHHDAVVLAPGSTERLAAILPEAAVFDRLTGACVIPGIFACGNAIRTHPTGMAVQSVASGRLAACSVSRFLAGRPLLLQRRPFDSRLGRVASDELAQLAAWTGEIADRTLRERSGAIADGTPPESAARAGSSSATAAITEALRCLRCDCRRKKTCRLRRYADAYDADQHRFPGEDRKPIERIAGANGLVFEPGKCIKCGICVRIAEQGKDRPGLAFRGRGFDVRVSVPFGEDIGNAVQATARECVTRCPTGALSWD